MRNVKVVEKAGIITVTVGKRDPYVVRYRRMTKEEVLKLGYGNHPYVLKNDGTVGECKVNGKVRTWKRDPDRVEVPLKYGLYEYATFGLREALDRLLVQVD